MVCTIAEGTGAGQALTTKLTKYLFRTSQGIASDKGADTIHMVGIRFKGLMACLSNGRDKFYKAYISESGGMDTFHKACGMLHKACQKRTLAIHFMRTLI